MAIETRDVEFYSGPQTRLSGRMYLPENAGGAPGPAVVFCHGFGGTKDGTPPGLSRLLAGRGYRVLTFDYRGFGTSGGPRGRLVPAEQVEDAVHALTFLAQQPGVDTGRIGLYGTSFGGGVAVLAAVRSPLVRALTVTVSVTSGSRWLQSMMRFYEFKEMQERAMQAIARKAATGEIEMGDRADIMIPDPVTREVYKDAIPMATETFYHVLHHEPVLEAHKVRIPVQVMTVKSDVLVNPQQSVELYERLAGPKTLHIFDAGHHFSVYDTLLPQVAERSIAWFDTHLA